MSALFSVIIPAYNVGSYLKDCFHSLNSQSFRDFEVIVVDDGSNDQTGSIADDFAASHRDVHVLHKQNEGLLIARRTGLEESSGEYIIHLDADDALRADALEKIADKIRRTDADIVSFLYSRKPNYSAPVKSAAIKPGSYSGSRFRLVREHVCRGRFNNLCGKAFKRACVDVEDSYVGHKGLMHGEDLLQLLPIADKSSSLEQLSDALYYYRPNAFASTAKFKHSQLLDIAQVNRRLLSYSRRWGGSCIAAAAVGEAKQYLNLLKIAVSSNLSSDKAELVFEEVRSAMEQEGVFDRYESGNHRIDDRLILDALRSGNTSKARFVIGLIEKMKAIHH